MPTSLPKHPALIIRDLLVNNWDPSNTSSYDPSITDPTDSNFLAISRGWYTVGGGHDPYVGLTNFGEGVLGGGQTGFSSMQGDGSGVGQVRDGTGLITVFAEADADYNGERAADIVDQIRTEIERIALEDVPFGGTTDFKHFSTSFDSESTDTDVDPPVEQQQCSAGYSWFRQ